MVDETWLRKKTEAKLKELDKKQDKEAKENKKYKEEKEKLMSKVGEAEKAAKKTIWEHPVKTAAVLEAEDPFEAEEIKSLLKDYNKNLKKSQKKNKKKRAKVVDQNPVFLNSDAGKKSSISKSSKRPGKLLFFSSFIVHYAALFSLSFKINWNTYFWGFLILFLFLLVWTFFVFRSSGILNSRTMIGLSLLGVAYVLLPLILNLFQNFFYNIELIGAFNLFHLIIFLLAVIPAFPLVIGYYLGRSITTKWVTLIVLLLLIVFVVALAVRLEPGRLVSITGTSQRIDIGGAFGFLFEELRDLGENVWKKINIKSIKSSVLNATGLNYYTGVIDNNEEEAVGLYIDNVRPADKYFYVGSPVVVWADIRGKSFTEEISVTPECYVDEEAAGKAEPSMFTIFGEEHDTLSCTFTGLDDGSHRATVAAGFNFETWAYVTYTFVDMDVKRSLQRQGKNVNYELDVEPRARAVYTNGPVMLGMSAMIDQPVGIDTQYNSREPVLGVTLDNLWTEGEIERVDEFIIQVPEDIQLVKCDRWYPDEKRNPFKTEEGYDFYRFSREELGDPRAGFKSVTCRLRIENPKEFLGGSQKVQRTFVARAKYYYNLEERVSLYVRE